MWVSFLATHLFPGSIHRPELGSWIFEMINVDSTSLSYLTSCCIGAAFYGRTNGMISEDLKDATVYYAQALRKLNDNLKDPDLWSHPVNVAASMLLGVYELMNFSNSEGFVKHAGGVGTLINLRGAESHLSFPARSYFVMSRMPVITEAIVYRKRCFLSDPKWQYVTTGLPKSPMRDSFELNDLMVRVPGIIADSDEARTSTITSGNPPEEFVRRFKSSVVAILRDLFIWRWAFEERNPGLAYEVPVMNGSLSVDEHRQPLFDKAIYYNHYHKGRQVGLFMVAVILVLHEAQSWNIMSAPAEALASLANYKKPPATGILTLPHDNISPAEAAQEIIRSVEFYLQGEHRLAGGLHLLVPLRMASPLITDPRQQAWLKRVTDKMAHTHGFKMSTRLQNAERFIKDWQAHLLV